MPLQLSGTTGHVRHLEPNAKNYSIPIQTTPAKILLFLNNSTSTREKNAKKILIAYQGTAVKVSAQVSLNLETVQII